MNACKRGGLVLNPMKKSTKKTTSLASFEVDSGFTGERCWILNMAADFGDSTLTLAGYVFCAGNVA